MDHLSSPSIFCLVVCLSDSSSVYCSEEQLPVLEALVLS